MFCCLAFIGRRNTAFGKFSPGFFPFQFLYNYIGPKSFQQPITKAQWCSGIIRPSGLPEMSIISCLDVTRVRFPAEPM